MLDINDLTIKQIKEIQQMTSCCSSEEGCPWVLGKNYFIRTVTIHLIGKLCFVSDKELLLKDASWVADRGRFHDALKTGELNEVEPFVNNVIVNRGSVIDATVWGHCLPTEQK